MLSRRDAFRLATAGYLVSTLPKVAAAQTPSAASAADMPMVGVSISPDGRMPGPAPSLDAPVAIAWRFQHAGTATGSIIVGGGGVFVKSDDGNLYALDAENGAERWRFWLGSGSLGTPAFSNGKLFVTGSSNALLALDAATGAVIWEYVHPDWVAKTAPFTAFADATDVSITDDTVMVSDSDRNLSLVDANLGQLRGTVSMAWHPVISGDMLVTDFSSVSACDMANLTPVWELRDDRARRILAVAGDQIALWIGAPGSSQGIAPGSALGMVDAATGVMNWALEDGEPYLRSVVIFEDTVIAEYLPAFDPGDEDVVAYDLATGTERWRTPFVGGTVPTAGPMVLIGETIYRLRGDSTLVTLDARTGAEGTVIPVVIPETLLRSQPAVVNGKLYVSGDGGMIYALANPMPTVLITDVELRGAPTTTGVSRGQATAGTEVSILSAPEETDGSSWVEVRVGDVSGWIPLEAIDPTSLPPDGEFDYVYEP